MQPSNHVAVGVQCDADVGVPEASCTTFGWTPACKARVAQPCRRSSNLIGGSPSRCTASEKPRVNRSGCNIVPSTWQKTRSRSVHPAPISSRSAACRLRCSCNAATVPASRVTVRRPFTVFGVPSNGVCLRAITVCRIDARLPSRSRSAQRKPNASPRRNPVVASTRYAVQGRLERGSLEEGAQLVCGPGDRLRAANC